MSEKEISGYECKHAIYVKGTPPDKGHTPDDMIFIKERIHYADGTTEPNVRLIKNFKRPFWVTKPGFRNHEEKKEWEDIEKLDRYECTQAELEKRIKKALNMFTPMGGLRKLARSPYLYGADITPTALIKRKYMDRYPEAVSNNTVAVLDIETDVVHGTDDPILISVTFKDKAIIAGVDWFFKGIDDPQKRLKEHFYTRLKETAQERNISLEVEIKDNIVDAIKAVIDKCHQWKPDFLSVWNINFDVPYIIRTLEKYGADPGDIFSDPKVPKEFRKLWYKEGPSKKVTANGREEPLHWIDRWHTCFVPASFYLIDQAAVFRRLRIAKGKEPSYALDAILTKYAGIKKLKNEKADQMSDFEWHIYMQQNEPLEYAIYNLYDCISCEILDEQPKVGDLRQTISTQCGHSDYDKFSSQPRRTVDDLHFLCLEHGKVIATTSDQLKTEWDDLVVSTSNWIVTLPAHLVADNGIKVIEEAEDLRTMIRTGVYDLDVTSAYPSGEDILNCSKETTVAEIVKIEGVPHELQRAEGINLTAGTTNATEICSTIMGAPTFEQLLDDLEKNGLEQ